MKRSVRVVWFSVFVVALLLHLTSCSPSRRKVRKSTVRKCAALRDSGRIRCLQEQPHHYCCEILSLRLFPKARQFPNEITHNQWESAKVQSKKETEVSEESQANPDDGDKVSNQQKDPERKELIRPYTSKKVKFRPKYNPNHKNDIMKTEMIQATNIPDLKPSPNHRKPIHHGIRHEGNYPIPATKFPAPNKNPDDRPHHFGMHQNSNSVENNLGSAIAVHNHVRSQNNPDSRKNFDLPNHSSHNPSNGHEPQKQSFQKDAFKFRPQKHSNFKNDMDKDHMNPDDSYILKDAPWAQKGYNLFNEIKPVIQIHSNGFSERKDVVELPDDKPISDTRTEQRPDFEGNFLHVDKLDTELHHEQQQAEPSLSNSIESFYTKELEKTPEYQNEKGKFAVKSIPDSLRHLNEKKKFSGGHRRKNPTINEKKVKVSKIVPPIESSSAMSFDHETCRRLAFPCRFVSDHPCCRYKMPIQMVARARAMDGSADLKWRSPIAHEARSRNKGPEGRSLTISRNPSSNEMKRGIKYTWFPTKSRVRIPEYEFSGDPESLSILLGLCWRLHYVRCDLPTDRNHPCCNIVRDPGPRTPADNRLTRWLQRKI